jgi:hypothetical protein
VFQKILNKEIEYPAHLSDNAKDLIDHIIMIDPMSRLGTPGSKFDMRVLKAHPFFEGIDWENLEKYNVREMLDLEDKERYESIKKKKMESGD